MNSYELFLFFIWLDKCYLTVDPSRILYLFSFSFHYITVDSTRFHVFPLVTVAKRKGYLKIRNIFQCPFTKHNCSVHSQGHLSHLWHSYTLVQPPLRSASKAVGKAAMWTQLRSGGVWKKTLNREICSRMQLHSTEIQVTSVARLSQAMCTRHRVPWTRFSSVW